MADGCWVGLKLCGCPVAVVRDGGVAPPEATESEKREMLRQGLQVVFATKEQWDATYLPRFLEDCTHREAE